MNSGLPMARAQPLPAPLAAGTAVTFRLFHALGGPASWFRVRVLPLMAQWATALTGCAPDTGAEVTVAWVLTRAALAAEGDSAGPPRSPEQRLAAAHRAGWTAILALRQRTPTPGTPPRAALAASACSSAPPCDDPVRARSRAADRSTTEPWGDASVRLVQDGRWSVLARPGRWRRLGSQAALLWPLAGQDLRALVAPGCTLAEVAAGLAQEGYLLDGHGGAMPCAGRRADGRILTVLPVGPKLLARLAIDPALRGAGVLEPVAAAWQPEATPCQALADA